MKNICVETPEQLNRILNMDFKKLDINNINISFDTFENISSVIDNIIIKTNKNPLIIGMKPERIGTGKDCIDFFINNNNINKIIIRNIDQYSYLLYIFKKIRDKSKFNNKIINFDYSMNVYNHETKKVLLNGLSDFININNIIFTYPLEQNTYELKELNFDELIVYGYIPVMVSNNCIFKTQNKCLNKNNTKIISGLTSIKDRKNENIIIKSYCKYCYNQIFNPYPLYLLDIIKELNEINKKYIRYDFSFENKKELENILLNNIKPVNFTRGHIKRGIE